MKKIKTTIISGVLMFFIFSSLTISLSNCGEKDNPKPINPVIINEIPVANAGPDQKIKIGNTVKLNGIDSKDPEGKALNFKWSIISKPESSISAITGSTSVQASFELDKAGVYVIELVVSDGEKTATDQIEITNKTPIINIAQFSGVAFSALSEGVTAERGGNIHIDGALFSMDFSEISVLLNGKVCPIKSGDERSLTVDIPEDATSGELIIMVGEEKTIFSKPVFIYTMPIHSLIELPIFNKVTEWENIESWEFGCIIKPKKNGKILGFKNSLGVNRRFTLWDFDSQTVLAEAIFDESTYKFETPITVEAEKEYMISINSTTGISYSSTSATNIFPSLQYDVEITGYGVNPGPHQIFPVTIYRDLNWINGPLDVYFVADL